MSGGEPSLEAAERRRYFGHGLRGALLQLDLLAHGIGEPAIPADCRPALQKAVQDALNAVREAAAWHQETERDLRDALNTIAWLRHTLDQTRALLDAAQQRAAESQPGSPPDNAA